MGIISTLCDLGCGLEYELRIQEGHGLAATSLGSPSRRCLINSSTPYNFIPTRGERGIQAVSPWLPASRGARSVCGLEPHTNGAVCPREPPPLLILASIPEYTPLLHPGSGAQPHPALTPPTSSSTPSPSAKPPTQASQPHTSAPPSSASPPSPSISHPPPASSPWAPRYPGLVSHER